MKETTLVILAAGIGSRFGGGIKQLAPVGPSGEIIMDYSIYDALKAGFNKIVFIIRKDIEEDFRRIIGDRISEIADVSYAFQDLSALPDGFSVPDVPDYGSVAGIGIGLSVRLRGVALSAFPASDRCRRRVADPLSGAASNG